MEIGLRLSIVALVIALIAAGIAYFSCHTATKMTRYTYLANKWYEIKDREFDNPNFTDLAKTSSYKTSFTGDSLKKYETFAWICWGHAEDIYLNKWHKDAGFKPSLKYYKNLHYSWLKDPENSKRFDSSFIKYIDALQ
ncbi:MAG: hypothetical protein OEW82_00535 [Dehalococcoidia bacterium]|nr:hypothetical protein [Dehalococcoidia bacterium]